MQAIHELTSDSKEQTLSLANFFRYTAKILYRKFETYIPRDKRDCVATVPIPTYMFLCAIYRFPRSVCIFCYKKIGGPIVGIYKSLTDPWMWKWVSGCEISFLGIHNSKFLCSVQFKMRHSPQLWYQSNITTLTFSFDNEAVRRNILANKKCHLI